MTDPNAIDLFILEPYYGGSHRQFVDVLTARSQHHCTLLSMPARKWKWRMRGSAFWFIEQIASHRLTPDVILANDMVDVAALKALLPRHLRDVPIVSYFHENQLTYPLSPDDRRDYQFGFTNITTCLASDRVWFNSRHHRDAFLAAAEDLLRQMPDHRPPSVVSAIRSAATVLYPPVEIGLAPEPRRPRRVNNPPRIVWNHRWEYDKNPDALIHAVAELKKSGVPFRLCLLGQSFRQHPAALDQVRRDFSDHLDHAGFVPDVQDYWTFLAESDIVLSTAVQENFGIATVQAVLAGCIPLLPNRLSYPELLPTELHAQHLYADQADLVDKLTRLIRNPPDATRRETFRRHLTALCAPEQTVADIDRRLRAIAAYSPTETPVSLESAKGRRPDDPSKQPPR